MDTSLVQSTGKEKEMKQYKNGSTITVYLSGNLLERIDEFTAEWNCSRSSLIEEAVEKYMNSFPSEEDAK